jgi:hypothetical protein
MFNVQGAIDGTHHFIFKPSMFFLKDYPYFKQRGYSILA